MVFAIIDVMTITKTTISTKNLPNSIKICPISFNFDGFVGASRLYAGGGGVCTWFEPSSTLLNLSSLSRSASTSASTLALPGILNSLEAGTAPCGLQTASGRLCTKLNRL